METETKEERKGYRCEICGEMFTQEESLKHYEKKKHDSFKFIPKRQH